MTTGDSISLRGKVALVTGSARRVGREIALELAREGMHLMVHYGADSSAPDAEITAAEIRAHGVECAVHQADLRDPSQIERLFVAVKARFEQLDVLVNNAATFQKKPLMEVTLHDWHDALHTNLTAPFLCGQHAARLILERSGSGAIINIADLSAFRPWKSFPVHSVSKAGLVSLTEVMALSLAPHIRVNAVAPGPVLRDEGNPPEVWQRIGERLPVGQTGHPRDVAKAVAFLAAAPFITGITLRVDGGEGIVWS
ncbi:MAG: SDR family oxidoreductase [Anaerolineae bacterium]